jgi:hypothetical protein
LWGGPSGLPGSALEAKLIEEDEMKWRRLRILIAAAATAALGAPIRILDIRSTGRWARKGRAGVRPASPAPFFRRSSAASQAENEPAPGPEAEQGGQGQ